MPGDYRDYEDASREQRGKEYELKTALAENRPKAEIEKLKKEVEKHRDHANYTWNRCVDIW